MTKKTQKDASRTTLVVPIDAPTLLPAGYYQKRLLARSSPLESWDIDRNVSHPRWLDSSCDFHSDRWICNFGFGNESITKEINFSIELEDGTLLVDDKNRTFLNSIKLFLIVQFHPKYVGAKRLRGEAENDRVRKALRFVDCILLNAELFKPASMGFSLFTKAKFKAFMIECAIPPAEVNVYNFNGRLSDWLRQRIGSVTPEEVNSLGLKYPSIFEVPPVEDCVLDLSPGEIILAKVWMINNNCSDASKGRVTFNSARFIAETYKNTLHGVSMSPRTPGELVVGDNFKREYGAMPVRASVDGSIDKVVFGDHATIIKRLCYVQSDYIDIGIDKDALQSLSAKMLYEQVTLRPEGRYHSVPAQVVINIVKTGYDWYRNAPVIFDAIMTVLRTLQSDNAPIRNRKRWANLIVSENADLCAIGIRKFISEPRSSSYKSKTDYFDVLRANLSLIRAYKLIVAAAIIFLGAISARRQSEFMNLRAEDCLFPNSNPYAPENSRLKYYLDFSLGKTGDFAERVKYQVKIPNIAAKVIWDLKSFSERCFAEGWVQGENRLFLNLFKGGSGFGAFSHTCYNQCLDLFCDHFNTPVVNRAGDITRRYYIRQHQLRRFFALAFFMRSGYESLEALQMYLGHINIEQTYRYVTEVTPENILRSVKADKITMSVMKGSDDIENLESLKRLVAEKIFVKSLHIRTVEEIADDYGAALTDDAVIDLKAWADVAEGALHDAVETLLADGTIDLLPEILVSYSANKHRVNRFRLVLRIKDRSSQCE